jgi:hypothetical protein
MPLRRRLRVMAVRQTKITTPTAINKPIGISATITQIICSPPVVPYSDTYNGTNRALTHSNIFGFLFSSLFAGSSLDKARRIFDRMTKHRPRIRLTIRQRTRVLDQWPRHDEKPQPA